MNDKSVCLITGSSSGIGYQLVLLLNELEDYKIYATSSTIDEFGDIISERVKWMKLDVTNEGDVNKVVNEILELENKIDIVVHCANIQHEMPVEYIDVDTMKTVINANAIGMMILNAKCLPSMQKRSSGHIIVVSDMSGVIGFPFQGAYSASKFAVEGYCEAIRDELKDYYIDVSLIETGPVISETHKHGRADQHFSSLSPEINCKDNISALMDTFTQNKESSYHTIAQSPKDIGKQIVDIITSPDSNRLRYMTNYICANALSPVFKENQISS